MEDDGDSAPSIPLSIDESLARIDQAITKLQRAASDGKRETLAEAVRRAKAMADAGGYRSPELKNMPQEYQHAVEDLENSVILTFASMLQWLRYSLGEKGWDSGAGDTWMRMEASRLELLKSRIQVLREKQQ
jgi:hypothetical protein